MGGWSYSKCTTMSWRDGTEQKMFIDGGQSSVSESLIKWIRGWTKWNFLRYLWSYNVFAPQTDGGGQRRCAESGGLGWWGDLSGRGASATTADKRTQHDTGPDPPHPIEYDLITMFSSVLCCEVLWTVFSVMLKCPLLSGDHEDTDTGAKQQEDTAQTEESGDLVTI